MIEIAVAWDATPRRGRVRVINGTLEGLAVGDGHTRPGDNTFGFDRDGPGRLALRIAADSLEPGADPTMVCVEDVDHPFTVFLRDVSAECPILIADYGVAVTADEDPRAYAQIHDDVRARGLRTGLEQIEHEPEASFDSAAAATREQHCPTWLGISRDVRIFEFGVREPMLYTDWIQPRFGGHGYFWEEKTHVRPRYGHVAGRGWGPTEHTTRRLEDGVLPILHVKHVDDAIEYETTAFVTLERSTLTAAAIRGTCDVVADGLTVCHVLSEKDRERFDRTRDAELEGDEQTVLCARVVATNTSDAPRYAFFKTVHPHAKYGNPEPYDFDGETGFGRHKGDDTVFAISRLDGRPLRQPEIAVLLRPGQGCTHEFLLPHSPVSRERAGVLAARDVDRCLDGCRAFWKSKLERAARIIVPERRIDEMVRAGLLHIDLNTFGREPDGALLAANGTYGAVAMEVIPLINFYDSMGLHGIARRALDHYLHKQDEDGFVQTFTGYMLETGCFLWGLGEHYRYTRDRDWAQRIKPHLLRSCAWITRRCAESRRDDLRGRGYGLIGGRVADPEDDERIFMLSGYAFLGLSRAADLLADIDADESRRVRAEADALRADVRAALFQAVAEGPAVPLGDGTWSPTAAPWVGVRGPVCLYTEAGDWWTHGAMTIRDDSLGPLRLVFSEVLDPDEPVTDLLLNYHCDLLRSGNVGFSQPYQTRHAYAHLQRGEARPFLAAYYNALASMADRRTYTFWEHFYHEALHKTAEEAQFLMQTRCMLYMEDGDTLRLMAGIPRAWMADGERIELKGVASYFGRLDVLVHSTAGSGSIEARVTCEASRRPRRVEVRLPHPEGRAPVSADGGRLDVERETVIIERFTGRDRVRVHF